MKIDIDGGCHCGSITFAGKADPAKVGICHCTDCQQITGSAFRVIVLTDAADFQLLSGTPKTYMKVADSGNKREQVFCPDCGSSLWARAVGENAETISLRVGSLRQRRDLPPQFQIWTESALDWLGGIEGIEKSELR